MAESHISEHIQGTEDEGETPNGYPVRVAGVNRATGKTQGVSIDNASGGVLTTPAPGGGKQPVTIADGDDVNAGATTDPANLTGAAGTESGKLRGILSILANVWDSVNTRLRVGAAQVGAWAVSVSNFPASQAVTIVDGGDVTEGALADAANTTGTAGTISGKLRGIVQLIAAGADLVNNWFRVSVQNATLAVTQSGAWTVAATQGTSPWIIQENNESVTGVLAGNGQVVYTNHNKGTAQVDIVGNLNANLAVEYSQDGGTTWYGLDGVNITTLGLLATSAFGALGNLPFNALYSIAGIAQIRVNCTAYVSGTATVIWTAGDSTISPNPLGRGLFFNSGFGAHSPADAAANANETVCSAANIGIFQWAMPHQFNNTTWDRERNNTQKTLLASAGRAASTNSSDQTNYNGRGVTVFFNISALAAAQTLTINVQLKDAVSGNYFTVFASGANAAAGQFLYQVYPGLAGAGLLSGDANACISRTWRVQVILGGSAGTSTYSVSATEQL